MLGRFVGNATAKSSTGSASVAGDRPTQHSETTTSATSRARSRIGNLFYGLGPSNNTTTTTPSGTRKNLGHDEDDEEIIEEEYIEEE